MKKVVLDTNVYISAIICGGVCEKILNLVAQGLIVVYTSPFILDEVSGVLEKKFFWQENRRKLAREELEYFTISVMPSQRLRVVKDEPDNRILECAWESKVDCIITGDRKHLVKLKKFKGIIILTPGDFWKLYS